MACTVDLQDAFAQVSGCLRLRTQMGQRTLQDHNRAGTMSLVLPSYGLCRNTGGTKGGSWWMEERRD